MNNVSYPFIVEALNSEAKVATAKYINSKLTRQRTFFSMMEELK